MLIVNKKQMMFLKIENHPSKLFHAVYINRSRRKTKTSPNKH
jgi:hypothetical protein